jgi:hypothetical protein
VSPPGYCANFGALLFGERGEQEISCADLLKKKFVTSEAAMR